MTTLVSATPTAVPGLLLRPVTWPEEAQLVVDVNNASRLAAGSLFVITVEMIRSFYDHLVNSDLATDLRLAEADGTPVGYVRVEWTDENRGDRVHSAALFVTPDAPAGSFAALLDWIVARHLEIARAQGPVDRPRTASVSTLLEPADARTALGITWLPPGPLQLRDAATESRRHPRPRAAGRARGPSRGPDSPAPHLGGGGRGVRRPLGRRRRRRVRGALAGVPRGSPPGPLPLAGRLGRRRDRRDGPALHQRRREHAIGRLARLVREHLDPRPVARARRRIGAHLARPARAPRPRHDPGGARRRRPERDRRPPPLPGRWASGRPPKRPSGGARSVVDGSPAHGAGA